MISDSKSNLSSEGNNDDCYNDTISPPYVVNLNLFVCYNNKSGILLRDAPKL
jgi:hypothetical protein